MTPRSVTICHLLLLKQVIGCVETMVDSPFVLIDSLYTRLSTGSIALAGRGGGW
jgi:hypothetical protein